MVVNIVKNTHGEIIALNAEHYNSFTYLSAARRLMTLTSEQTSLDSVDEGIIRVLITGIVIRREESSKDGRRRPKRIHSVCITESMPR